MSTPPHMQYTQSAAPSRDLPISVPLACLFGGFFNQFGWLFFGLGLIFVWVFGANGDWSILTWRGSAIGVTEGVVTDVVQTAMSEGGSDSRPGRPIHEFTFSYEVGGVPYLSQSYSSTTYAQRDSRIEVEYLEKDPKQARIKDMRTAPFGSFVALVLLFPLVGIGFILFGIKRGLKTWELCREGVFTSGKVVGKERTNTRINKRIVYRLTIEFEDMYGQTQRFDEKTHKPELLEDDAEERIIYHPRSPERAVALDVLPAAPEIKPDGSIVLHNSGFVALYLIIPVVTVIGHGGYLMQLLGG